MQARWRVGLVVIARDEAATLKRLLDSVRPHVDDVLVMDTGSTDDTPRIAQAAGARLATFTWCDDFSAARNAALAASASDWHLVLDADEWLIDGGDVLAALRHTSPDFVGTIALQDQFDGGTAQARLSRVLPGAVRYAGRIHEQPIHGLPVRPLAMRVGHDGYLPDRLQAKQGRNALLLQRALEDRPHDAYLWYQLGKDAFVYEDHAKAESAFAAAAERLSSPPSWWRDLVARRLFALKRLKRHAEGMALAESQLQTCADSPDFFFAVGDLLLDWAADEPTLAETLLPMIEDAWRRCLEIGERPDQTGAVTGRGSHLAAYNLALVLDATGRADEARALRQSFPSLG
ncbi:glycosyltransferase [Roseateles amylovorans]|uniref:Glycosyltransferase n=1 Tax=Roseateles amylovorans TaxID=2978473 RepID=A0ABY6B5I6_9BURK|nr:glycosyltransferase [Roseateles amylovorans]UXH79800.1 glycosyltransferase [Roseateles amylovorans]